MNYREFHDWLHSPAQRGLLPGLLQQQGYVDKLAIKSIEVVDAPGVSYLQFRVEPPMPGVLAACYCIHLDLVGVTPVPQYARFYMPTLALVDPQATRHVAHEH